MSYYKVTLKVDPHLAQSMRVPVDLNATSSHLVEARTMNDAAKLVMFRYGNNINRVYQVLEISEFEYHQKESI